MMDIAPLIPTLWSLAAQTISHLPNPLVQTVSHQEIMVDCARCVAKMKM